MEEKRIIITEKETEIHGFDDIEAAIIMAEAVCELWNNKIQNIDVPNTLYNVMLALNRKDDKNG